MSGTTKVILITVLAVFALAMFNLSIWRRMRAAVKAAADEAETTPDTDHDDLRPGDRPR